MEKEEKKEALLNFYREVTHFIDYSDKNKTLEELRKDTLFLEYRGYTKSDLSEIFESLDNDTASRFKEVCNKVISRKKDELNSIINPDISPHPESSRENFYSEAFRFLGATTKWCIASQDKRDRSLYLMMDMKLEKNTGKEEYDRESNTLKFEGSTILNPEKLIVDILKNAKDIIIPTKLEVMNDDEKASFFKEIVSKEELSLMELGKLLDITKKTVFIKNTGKEVYNSEQNRLSLIKNKLLSIDSLPIRRSEDKDLSTKNDQSFDAFVSPSVERLGSRGSKPQVLDTDSLQLKSGTRPKRK